MGFIVYGVTSIDFTGIHSWISSIWSIRGKSLNLPFSGTSLQLRSLVVCETTQPQEILLSSWNSFDACILVICSDKGLLYEPRAKLMSNAAFSSRKRTVFLFGVSDG